LPTPIRLRAFATGATHDFSTAAKKHDKKPKIDGKDAWCSLTIGPNEYFQINTNDNLVNFDKILIQGYKHKLCKF
jgi:hypothetical protein